VSMILTVRHLSGSLTGKSQRVALQEGQALRLGRAPENDIKFTDAADDSVSGMHAELSLQGGRLFIEDKRSSNGTFVNGAPCPPFQKVAVPDGSRIRLAKQGPEMQLTAEAAPAVAAPSVTATGAGVTAPQPKESVGRATMLREIDRARQEERDVMVGELSKTKKSTGLWVGIGLLLVLLLAGGGIGGAMWWNKNKVEKEKAALLAEQEKLKTAAESEKNVWADVEKKVSPAVVHVICLYRVHIPLRTARNLAQGEILLDDAVTGSGVQIRPGLILTAKHVVEPWVLKYKNWDKLREDYAAQAQYDRIQIQFPGQQPINATVTAVAENQDLALLQVQPTTAPNVSIVRANSDVKVTNRIAVLGYPANLGQKPILVKNLSGFGSEWTRIMQVTPTFVVGTVSQSLTGAAGSNYVHFDASVTHGNSGGAVVNDRGELIGIVSAQFQYEDTIKAYGLEIPFQVPVGAGNMAVSPDDIQAFLRNRGII
jgi:S1-C subfamily serine protease